MVDISPIGRMYYVINVVLVFIFYIIIYIIIYCIIYFMWALGFRIKKFYMTYTYLL